MGGSSGGQASFQTPSALYGAENQIFNPLPYPNTGQAAQNAYSGIGALGTTGAPYSLTQGGNSALLGGMAAGSYAPQALAAGFDPMNKQYAQQFAQNQNQANAVNAMSGVANTPYGAGLTQQADQNFNLNWEQQALQRQQTGAQTAASLLGAQNAGIAAGGNALTQGAGLQQQQIQDYLAYLQASSGNAAQYFGATSGLTNAASGSTNAVNYGNQINNQATAGLGSLAGTLGSYLLLG